MTNSQIIDQDNKTIQGVGIGGNDVLSIMFENTSHTPPTPNVRVYATLDAYGDDLTKLQAMKHIRVVLFGATSFCQ